MKGFEEVEHTADWAFRARGCDLAELFANAAHGMFELQAGKPPPAAPAVERAGIGRKLARLQPVAVIKG